jgi:hypothetical protein
VRAVASRRPCRPEQRSCGIVAVAGGCEPGFEPFCRFGVQRDETLLFALAVDFEDAVNAGGLAASDLQPGQLADSATAVGKAPDASIRLN